MVEAFSAGWSLRCWPLLAPASLGLAVLSLVWQSPVALHPAESTPSAPPKTMSQGAVSLRAQQPPPCAWEWGTLSGPQPAMCHLFCVSQRKRCPWAPAGFIHCLAQWPRNLPGLPGGSWQGAPSHSVSYSRELRFSWLCFGATCFLPLFHPQQRKVEGAKSAHPSHSPRLQGQWGPW